MLSINAIIETKAKSKKLISIKHRIKQSRERERYPKVIIFDLLIFDLKGAFPFGEYSCESLMKLLYKGITMKLNSARISKNTIIPIRTNIVTLKCIFDKYNIFKSQNQGAKAKMLGQINDYKNITINTNANPQAIASAINSYSYDDDF